MEWSFSVLKQCPFLDFVILDGSHTRNAIVTTDVDRQSKDIAQNIRIENGAR